MGVILFHSPVLPGILGSVQASGERGVQLFFAISGFLICTRLIEERRAQGHISLRGFYLRRLLRIQPAAIAYLITLGCLSCLGIIHLSLEPTLSALLCFRNYYAVGHFPSLPDDGYTAHFWTLSIEEHFYLFLPGLLVWGRRAIVPMLSVLTLVSVIWTHYLSNSNADPIKQWRTDVSMRNLLVPTLLAVIMQYPAFRSWITKASSYSSFLLLTLAMVIVSKVFFGGHMFSLIICFGFPLVIIGTTLHPHSWLGWILESKPLLFVGRISYSLYLWQQLFIVRTPHSSLQRFPWNWLAVFSCSMISHYVIERPFINLGHKLSANQSVSASYLVTTQ
jgi:peptidoglycan/LPS O-acetylase OafA/YrhL